MLQVPWKVFLVPAVLNVSWTEPTLQKIFELSSNIFEPQAEFLEKPDHIASVEDILQGQGFGTPIWGTVFVRNWQVPLQVTFAPSRVRIGFPSAFMVRFLTSVMVIVPWRFGQLILAAVVAYFSLMLNHPPKKSIPENAPFAVVTNIPATIKNFYLGTWCIIISNR